MKVDRRRVWLIAGLSVALHAAVLAWLAWPAAPTLLALGPDLSLMSVELIAPPKRALAPARSAAASASRRPVSPAVSSSVVAPAPAAPAGQAAAPASPAPSGDTVAPAALRNALRAGAGCTRVSGSRQEREACEEKLGRLGADTPSYAAPMDPDKRAYFDELAAAGASGGKGYGDPTPKGVSPGAAYFRVLNCSVTFGGGKKEKDRQGMVRLGKTPCYIPLQGSFFTPEAGVHKR